MSELSTSAAPKGLSVDKDSALSIHFDWHTLLPLASVASRYCILHVGCVNVPYQGSTVVHLVQLLGIKE
ncbi:MAG: hypothetical protein LBF87_00625 [Treponema sp.]|jgi:hypothetical protein|nr:hypothetical protein [Treponema sp.]